MPSVPTAESPEATTRVVLMDDHDEVQAAAGMCQQRAASAWEKPAMLRVGSVDGVIALLEGRLSQVTSR